MLLHIAVEFAWKPYTNLQIDGPEEENNALTRRSSVDAKIQNTSGVLSCLISYIFKSKDKIDDRMQSVKVISEAITTSTSMTKATLELSHQTTTTTATTTSESTLSVLTTQQTKETSHSVVQTILQKQVK